MTNALFQSDIKSLKLLNRGKLRVGRTGEKYRDALKRLTGNA